MPENALLPRRLTLLAAALFLLLALLTAFTRMPWIDEGLFADPGMNLAAHGFMGSPVIAGEKNLTRIDQRTYWIMPLYPVLQGAWYKCAGFGLFSQRSLSILFGLLGLLSWYVFLRKVAGGDVASLASVLLAFDYIYVTVASFGRNDIVSAAFGAASFAAYMLLREDRLQYAVLASHALLALSLFSHPNAVLWIAGSACLALYYDSKRLRPAHALVAAIPYLILAGAWTVYILQDLPAFLDQFGANASYDRFASLRAPWKSIRGEIVSRYMVAFGMGGHSSGHSGPIMLKALVLAGYVLSVLAAVAIPALRRNPALRLLLLLLGVFFLIQCFFNQKLYLYLAHIVPLYDAVLAFVIVWLWSSRRVPRFVLAGFLVLIAAVQAGGLSYRAGLDEYRRQYLPAVRFLRANLSPGALVSGSAALIYDLPPGQLVYDRTLGYYNGRKPSFVVCEDAMDENIEGLRSQPALYRFVRGRLAGEYDLVYRSTSFKIYKAR